MGKVLYFSAQEINDNKIQRNGINISYIQEIKKPSSIENQKVAKEISLFFTDLKILGITPLINDVWFGYITDKKKLQLEHGACIWNPANSKIATFSINPEIINNPVTLKNTIYHELGHCILGLDHNNNLDQKKGLDIPLSIMHESGINDEYVYHNFEVYKQRLFADGLNNKGNYNPGYLEFFYNKVLAMFISPIVKTFNNLSDRSELTSFKIFKTLLVSICHVLALLYLVSFVRKKIFSLGQMTLSFIVVKPKQNKNKSRQK